MNFKKIIKTKTFKIGLAKVIAGLLVIILNGDNVGGVEQIAGGILFALGITTVCIRDAISKTEGMVNLNLPEETEAAILKALNEHIDKK